MDLLNYVQPPFKYTIGEGDNKVTLTYSVLLNEDLISLQSIIRDQWFNFIDNDKTIKNNIEKIKLKFDYKISIADTIDYAISDPTGRQIAMFLSLSKVHKDIKIEDIQKMQLDPNIMTEIIYYILGIPLEKNNGEDKKK